MNNDRHRAYKKTLFEWIKSLELVVTFFIILGTLFLGWLLSENEGALILTQNTILIVFLEFYVGTLIWGIKQIVEYEAIVSKRVKEIRDSTLIDNQIVKHLKETPTPYLPELMLNIASSFRDAGSDPIRSQIMINRLSIASNELALISGGNVNKQRVHESKEIQDTLETILVRPLAHSGESPLVSYAYDAVTGVACLEALEDPGHFFQVHRVAATMGLKERRVIVIRAEPFNELNEREKILLKKHLNLVECSHRRIKTRVYMLQDDETLESIKHFAILKSPRGTAYLFRVEYEDGRKHFSRLHGTADLSEVKNSEVIFSNLFSKAIPLRKYIKPQRTTTLKSVLVSWFGLTF